MTSSPEFQSYTEMDKKAVAFLEGEIVGLRSRIGSSGNAVQAEKLEMLRYIVNRFRGAIAKQEAA